MALALCNFYLFSLWCIICLDGLLQAEWEEVANRADLLKQENSSLKEELKQLQEKCDSLTSENTSLHEKLKALEDEKSNGNWYKD